MKRIKNCTISILLALGFSASAWALDSNDFSLEQFGMSLDQVKQAAVQGDPDAEYALGYMYYYGQGVPRDEHVARVWIGKAASQGQPQAVKALQMLTQNNNPLGTQGNQFKNPYATTAKAIATTGPTASQNTVPPAAIPGDPDNVTPPNIGPVAAAKNTNTNNNTPNLANNPAPATTTVSSADAANNPPAVVNLNSDTAAPVAVARATVPKHESLKKVERQRLTDENVAERHIKATTLSEKKLLSAPVHYYTVQLLGSHSKQEVSEFIQQNRLQGKAIYYESNFQGKPWYVLVYGIYPTDQAAEAALKQLPLAVQKLNPWVKSIGSVKAGIKTG